MHDIETVTAFLSGRVIERLVPFPTTVELKQTEEAVVTFPMKLTDLVEQHVPAYELQSLA